MSLITNYLSNNQFNKGELLYKSIFKSSFVKEEVITKAFKHFITAASNNHTTSQLRVYQLYRMCCTDLVVCYVSKEDSIVWLTRSAMSGNSDAQCLLGQLYMDCEIDVENRYKLAYEWFDKSQTIKSFVNQGHMLYYGLNGHWCRQSAFKKYNIALQMGWIDNKGLVESMFDEDYIHYVI
jgi:TPR repeat protein